MINHKTKLNLVIGHPLEHTQSPLLHNKVYKLLNCNVCMLTHVTKNLSDTIKAVKTLGVNLIAVTMPFKEKIISYLDVKDKLVDTLQAANTVIYKEDKLLGYNTDIDGIHYALRHIELKNKNILVIGAGGAARALAYYLNQNQSNLYWLNRSSERVNLIIKNFGGEEIKKTDLKNLSIDVIVNTTPVGMFPNYHESPLLDYEFQKNQVVFDMIYHPAETSLLKNAKKMGAHCITGLDMFIGQGLKQIELWLNRSIQSKKIMTSLTTLLKRQQHFGERG